MNPLMLTPKQAAELSGLPVSTIRRLMADGVLPARKVGRRWYLHTSGVLEFCWEKSGPAYATMPRRFPRRMEQR